GPSSSKGEAGCWNGRSMDLSSDSDGSAGRGYPLPVFLFFFCKRHKEEPEGSSMYLQVEVVLAREDFFLDGALGFLGRLLHQTFVAQDLQHLTVASVFTHDVR